MTTLTGEIQVHREILDRGDPMDVAPPVKITVNAVLGMKLHAPLPGAYDGTALVPAQPYVNTVIIHVSDDAAGPEGQITISRSMLGDLVDTIAKLDAALPPDSHGDPKAAHPAIPGTAAAQVARLLYEHEATDDQAATCKCGWREPDTADHLDHQAEVLDAAGLLTTSVGDPGDTATPAS